MCSEEESESEETRDEKGRSTCCVTQVELTQQLSL